MLDDFRSVSYSADKLSYCEASDRDALIAENP